MSNFEDDDLDEGAEANEEPIEVEEAPNGNNRNFLLAAGILGGIFLLLIIGLVVLFLSRGRANDATTAIQQTNQVILLALSMLVITALVGTRDLGQEVYIALTKADSGRGIVAGLCVAFLGIVLDRLAAAGAQKTRQRLGLVNIGAQG